MLTYFLQEDFDDFRDISMEIHDCNVCNVCKIVNNFSSNFEHIKVYNDTIPVTLNDNVEAAKKVGAHVTSETETVVTFEHKTVPASIDNKAPQEQAEKQSAKRHEYRASRKDVLSET
ncbi:hypothetical protein EAI_15465 [Harpegnathos saltator]|uniref:Uncharacterized protein n=1 Tax=Harpegnathos saltator TaxID=610380 RepID=E2BC43_HARSA|nr:hypothetical protein EAI_15465 [Harpegnathos saltator]